MELANTIIVCALLYAWGASLFAERRGGRSSSYAVRSAKRGAGIAAAAVIIAAIALTARQYMMWRNDAVLQYMLPPHNSAWYFIQYSFTRFWVSYALSAAAAAVVFFAARALNRHKRGMLFEREEVLYMALGAFAAGHPGWLAYGAFAAVLYALFAAAARRSAGDRVSFYRAWLPCAIVIVLAEQALLAQAWYADFLV
jgi:hypothetical protein